MFGHVDKEMLLSKHDNCKVMIVSDETVWKYYKNRFEGIDFFLVPPGEESKHMDAYLAIVDHLKLKGYDRTDCIVALGGGVVGDLAGFVASTYMRGMKLVQIPTTLLAMVDSSIGGKTGINTTGMKNGLGTFYSAEAIYWDSSFLKTLPKEEVSSGMAEVIKYALGFDPEMYDKLVCLDLDLSQNLQYMEEVIMKCVRIKQSIVAKDFRDQSERMLLNFGHTYGHAIETYYSYRKYSHGEAIAIGMAYKIKSAFNHGNITESQKQNWLNLFEKFALPTELEISEHLCGILDLMRNDKKKTDESIRIVQMETVGRLKVKEVTVQELMQLHGCNFQMKKSLLKPGQLEGVLNSVPSKSLAHRAIIAASMSKTPSIVGPIDSSDDMHATVKAMISLGASVECVDDGYYKICWQKASSDSVTIDCKESGSTLRFLIPFASLMKHPVTFTGSNRLGERPLEPYFEIFNQQDLNYETEDGRLPLTIYEPLKPGVYKLPGNVSSQFITGLMMLLPLLNGDSTIELTTDLESEGYVQMTLDVLKHYGVKINTINNGRYEIPGNQAYFGNDFTVEGDYSQAAFWLSANQLGSNIELKGLNTTSSQGDRAVVHWLRVITGLEKNRIVDVSQCPDLLPVLSVVAALTPGRTEFINGMRVRIKESDRIHAMAVELSSIGANVIETEAGLIIEGKESLLGGHVYAWNDHRIAMALAIASIKCSEPVVIYGSESVRKSYPDFWNDFVKMGGKVDVKYVGQIV